jgi:hypothetical protein
LLDTHVCLVCPVKSCGRDIVSVIRWADGFEVFPLTTKAARRDAWRHVARAQGMDRTFALVAGVAVIPLTAFLAFWQFIAPGQSRSDNVMGMLAICAGGVGLVLVLVGGLAVDLAVGVRAWRRTLPRPLLNLMALPETYR